MRYTRHLLPLLICSLLVTSCANSRSTESLSEQAQRIAQNSIIVDTHIDLPYRLHKRPVDIFQPDQGGDFDYPRARSGGLNAPFMSIYTAAELEAEGTSRALAEELIDMVHKIAASAPDKFAIARSPADVRRHFAEGRISLPLGMENGSPIEGDLADVKHFFDRGIRYITLAHSLSNHISDSSYDENRQWNGLSEFGVDVVREMNRLGIMVDVSHLSDEAFWQIMKLSTVPVIASHSSARHFTPGLERNMSDDMIRALGENGGIIHINFGSFFLTEAAMKYSLLRSKLREEYGQQHPGLDEDTLEEIHTPLFAAEYGPYPYATLDTVLDHIDHCVQLAGVDHVGLGSDYDGVGDSLPDGLKDAATYPALIEGLLRRGYSEQDIGKILGENLLRVWAEVERQAE